MIEDVKNIISSVKKTNQGFVFKKYKNSFWGKDSNDYVVFGLVSKDNVKSLIESTKSLSLLLNVECEIDDNKQKRIEKLNILILKNNLKIEMFINLAEVFIKNIDKYSFLDFFLYLKELFSIETKVNLSELQGLFGELYALYYFKEILNLDISKYYQSSNKMKFDFSISNNKKMDVKTTLKTERIHHFTNEQLNSLRYDIKIISIMLQKDDKGVSLYDLIKRCKILFSNNLSILLNIEKIIMRSEDTDLKTISYNENYILDNLRIYDSKDIPRLTEKTKEGIFNIEYDSNLSGVKSLSQGEIEKWIYAIEA